MKILLVGEYSRLHNSLKEGLIALGHEAVIVGHGDGFKNYDVDYLIEKRWDSGWKKKVKVGIFKLTGFDISSYLTYRDFKRQQRFFSGFDIVQLINENSFNCQPKYEKRMLSYLFANNKKSFLLSCGDDYLNVKYNFENPNSKSVLQPYLAGKISDKNFQNVLKFRKKSFKKLHDFIINNVSGIISSDLDYHIALQNHRQYLGMIPNPVNVDKIKFIEQNQHKAVRIFFGINTETYHKKGLEFFEQALTIIKAEFAEKVDIKITRDLPYADYINLYDKANILLDQVYANDQGYNALEAMAKGKVVFTGAENVFIQHYNITDDVAINAVPDVDELVTKIRLLLQNPTQIDAIRRNARSFIEREHHYVEIAKKYVQTWTKA